LRCANFIGVNVHLNENMATTVQADDDLVGYGYRRIIITITAVLYCFA